MSVNLGAVKVVYLNRYEVKHSRHKVNFLNPRVRSGLMLVLADAISFSIAAFLAILVRVPFHDGWRFDLYPQMVPVMLVSMVFYSLFGLYPALGLSAVAELRKLVTSTSVVVLAFAALSFWVRNAEDYSRLTLGLTWIFSLFLLPLGRDLMRTIGARLNIWGETVAVIGCGKQSEWALEFFLRNRLLGLIPSVILDFSGNASVDYKNIRVLESRNVTLGKDLAELTGVETALIIASDVPADFVNYLADNRQGGFKRLLLIPNLEQISSYGVNAFDFGGVLGLEVRHNLLDAGQQTLKRAMDILLVLFGGLLISPFLGLLWLLLKWDSKEAGAFFGHTRIGKGNREFCAWKFRTMVPNADAKLEEFLAQNPEALVEWEANHKLKNDPRVTWLGRILRRYSIDELPQLWNVLKGEMSLIGPRPIVSDEVRHYGSRFDPYTWVRPGLTGLWQISGRNDTTYEERVSLDEYYVRNWSIWLDIYILARTVAVVLQRKGAY